MDRPIRRALLSVSDKSGIIDLARSLAALDIELLSTGGTARALTEAEKRGYDRAMNQAVKQQYWVIQNQQRSRETTDERDARLVAVVIPETKINGVVQNAHVEYVPVQP